MVVGATSTGSTDVMSGLMMSEMGVVGVLIVVVVVVFVAVTGRLQMQSYCYPLL